MTYKNNSLLSIAVERKKAVNYIWLKDFIIPELKPGQVVIMDNATFHKSQES